MQKDEQRHSKLRAKAQRQPSPKPKWVKPIIRARGSFDKQALACAVGRTGFPPCNGGVS